MSVRGVPNAAIRLRGLQESKNAAKSAYVQAVADRSAAQRKISDLLTRKSTWNDAELAEYTTLLHKEHSFAKAEENNEREYQQAEDHMERGFDDLMRSVMRRYHEEHLWSDRVRSVSSYISLGLGVANGTSILLKPVLIFMLALLLVEPYKRWKLARALEERVIHNEQEAYNRMQATISSIETHLEQLEEDITGKKRTKSVPNALRDSAPPAAPPGGSNTMMPPTPPRRIFPALPRLTWVDNVVHWFHVFRDYTVGFLRSWLPSAPSEQTTLAASTTGALVAGIATFWASTLFL